MWFRRSAKCGGSPFFGEAKLAAQPTCMCAFALSTAKNESSSADSRPFIVRLSSPRYSLEGDSYPREAISKPPEPRGFDARRYLEADRKAQRTLIPRVLSQ